MSKPPAPSKLTMKQLDQIMVDDSIATVRYYKSGKIDKKAEDTEIACNRRIQKETNYQEYRDWYKGLSLIGRTVLDEDLGW